MGHGAALSSDAPAPRKRKSVVVVVASAAAPSSAAAAGVPAAPVDDAGAGGLEASPTSLFREDSDALFLLDADPSVAVEADAQAGSQRGRRGARKRGPSEQRRRELMERKAEKMKRFQELLETRRRDAEKRLVVLQENVDYNINLIVKARLNRALMIMGVLCFIALAICTVALLSSPQVVVSAFSESALPTVESEFAGYGSWTAFVSQCCCTAGIDFNAAPVVVAEKWICGSSGRIRERQRARKLFGNATVVDGYGIRPLCATTFASGCQLVTTVVGSDRLVSVNCSGSGTALSAYQLARLW
jgi:hypothetical protein